MDIALKLTELLENSGVSRSKLARDIGVHTSTVSNWLDGRAVKSENLASLCAYFNCSLDYLTDTTEQKEKMPTLTKKDEREITFDDFTYAMQNESKDLSDNDKEILLSLAKQLKNAKRARDGENK